MDIWKNKVGDAFQKFNSAGRHLLSNFRQDKTAFNNEKNKPEFESLSFLREDNSAEDIEIDPCLECDKDFGILTINEEEGDFFGYCIEEVSHVVFLSMVNKCKKGRHLYNRYVETS